jgi:nicotinamide riboside kinase
LNTVWVEEYAREYLETKDNHYTEPDLLAIAQGQIAAEDNALSAANNFLVCDTDLYVLKVWSEHRFQRVHPWILETIATRPYDLYLLCDTDLPWSPDPQREYPDLEMRRYFFNVYSDIVQHAGVPWALISGPGDQRLAQALKAIAQHFPPGVPR